MARFKLKRKYFGVKEAIQNIINDKIGPANPISMFVEADLKRRGIKIIKRKSFNAIGVDIEGTSDHKASGKI